MPHGDRSVYEAMVNMSQDFKQRYPLVDMQGNHGNLDGDPPAAMRYTEGRLSVYGDLMLTDLDKGTVDFVPNYDESEKETVVLSGLFPNLLCSYVSGIAVGIGTSFVPHMAKDVYKAVNHIIDKTLEGEEYTDDELIDIIKAPDFPTGGIITSLKEIHQGYKEGKGSVKIRSKYHTEIDKKGNESIIITEIPFGVIKSRLVSKIDELRKDNIIPDIKEVRDESDRDGIRVVIDLKKNANTELTINKLLKDTEMATTVSMNHQALVKGKIREHLTLKELLEIFLEHSIEIVRNKIKYDLPRKQKRLHILEGSVIITPNINEVIDIIKEANSDEEIVSKFSDLYSLDEEQTSAILSRQIRTLKKISIDEYNEEINSLTKEIQHLTNILNDDFELLNETKVRLNEVAVKFEKEERLTEISCETTNSLTDKDYIAKEDIMIMITHKGIIKAVKTNEYNAQKKNGKGVSSKLVDDDFVENIISLTNHDNLVFITNIGKAYILPAYQIPIVSKKSVGKYVQNYVSLEESEKIINIVPIKENDDNVTLFFASKKGLCKRLSVKDLPSTKSGAKVINIKDDDSIIGCTLVEDNDIVLLATNNGFAVRTPVSNIRLMGRAAAGVTGIKFKDDSDYVVSVLKANNKDQLLIVTDKGIAKRMNAEDIRITNRGSKGVSYYKPTKNTGAINIILIAEDDKTIFVVTQLGMTIRIPASSIKVMSRTATGSKIVNLQKDDIIASVSSAPMQEDEIEEEKVEV